MTPALLLLIASVVTGMFTGIVTDRLAEGRKPSFKTLLGIGLPITASRVIAVIDAALLWTLVLLLNGLADWAFGTAGAAILVTFTAGAFAAISVRSLIYQFFSK